MRFKNKDVYNIKELCIEGKPSMNIKFCRCYKIYLNQHI